MPINRQRLHRAHVRIPTIPLLPQSELQLPTIDWTNRPQRFMNPGELEVLIALIATTRPKTVVEFGVNVGRTAQAILEYVPGIERYVGIDVPFGHVPNKPVQRNEVPEYPGALVANDPRFTLLLPTGGSQELVDASLPRQVDAVFIDGDHSRPCVLHDTLLALHTVRPGGLVIWHDYHNLGTVDVKSVLDEKFAEGWPLQHVENTWIVFMTV